nr:immunoglobulin light chain junction region [Macaca mulatta]
DYFCQSSDSSLTAVLF